MTARLDFAGDVEDAGFPKVAALLRQGEVRLAWAELRRFQPASLADAHCLERARRAMPEPPVEPEDLGDEDPPPPAPSPDLERALGDVLRREGIVDPPLVERLAAAVRSCLGGAAPSPEPPRDVPPLRRGRRGPRAGRGPTRTLAEDDDE